MSASIQPQLQAAETEFVQIPKPAGDRAVLAQNIVQRRRFLRHHTMSVSPRKLKSLPLKEIILVRPPPRHPRPERSKKIGWNKQRPPPLALPDMNALMRAGNQKQIRISREHDMTQSHRRCPAG